MVSNEKVWGMQIILLKEKGWFCLRAGYFSMEQKTVKVWLQKVAEVYGKEMLRKEYDMESKFSKAGLNLIR